MLVLGETDVEELLDPAGCLDAVERALVALATGEIHLPLRMIVRPPGDESLIGLMPVHRGGEERLYGLKTVVVVPGNSGARPRPPSGHGDAVRRRDRADDRRHERVSDHRYSYGRSQRARDPRAGAGGCASARHRRRRLSGQGAPRSARRSAPVRRHSHRLANGGESRGAGRAPSGGTGGGVRRGGRHAAPT